MKANKNKNMEKESKDSSRSVNLQVSLEYSELKDGKEVTKKVAKLNLSLTDVEKLTRSALRGAVLGVADGLKDAVSEGDDEFEDLK